MYSVYTAVCQLTEGGEVSARSGWTTPVTRYVLIKRAFNSIKVYMNTIFYQSRSA